MYDYTDAYDQARQARKSMPQPGIAGPWIQEPPMSPFPGIPQAPAVGQPPWGQATPPAASGPMGGLQNSVGQVLSAAYGPRGPRYESPIESMIKGALLGAGSVLVWRGMQRRHAVKGEFTSPGFRALGLLLVFPVIGLALSMLWVPESGYFLGWGCALGAASLTAYATYRATGHGNYNSRRRGSPWRDDHRRGSRRTF